MQSIDLIFQLRDGIDETNFKLEELQGQFSAGQIPIEKYKTKKEELEKYIKDLTERIEVLKKKLPPQLKFVLEESDLILEVFQGEFDSKQLGIIKILFLLDQDNYFIVPVDFRNPKDIQLEFPEDLKALIGEPEELNAWSRISDESFHVKDLLEAIQGKLNAKQDMFREIEAISEQYDIISKTDKTNLKVKLYGLDMKEFFLQINVAPYPRPPLVKLPPPLDKYIFLKSLNTLREWESKKLHVVDVLGEISSVLDRKMRLNREMSLFKEAKIPASYDEINSVIKVSLQATPQSAQINFLIKIPRGYPHSPPIIDVITPLTNSELREQIRNRLNQATAEYLELQNFSDVFSSILEIVKQHSEFICKHCSQFNCPTCNKTLFSSIPGVIGETNCYRRTGCCGSTMHECCWKAIIKRTQRCPMCSAPISRR